MNLCSDVLLLVMQYLSDYDKNHSLVTCKYLNKIKDKIIYDTVVNIDYFKKYPNKFINVFINNKDNDQIDNMVDYNIKSLRIGFSYSHSYILHVKKELLPSKLLSLNIQKYHPIFYPECIPRTLISLKIPSDFEFKGSDLNFLPDSLKHLSINFNSTNHKHFPLKIFRASDNLIKHIPQNLESLEMIGYNWYDLRSIKSHVKYLKIITDRPCSNIYYFLPEFLIKLEIASSQKFISFKNYKIMPKLEKLVINKYIFDGLELFVQMLPSLKRIYFKKLYGVYDVGQIECVLSKLPQSVQKIKFDTPPLHFNTMYYPSKYLYLELYSNEKIPRAITKLDIDCLNITNGDKLNLENISELSIGKFFFTVRLFKIRIRSNIKKLYINQCDQKHIHDDDLKRLEVVFIIH